MARLTPRVRRLLASVFGAAVVVATIVAVGTGPFLHGVASVSAASIAAAVLLTAAATAAAAWRWTLVARALGLTLRWRGAVVAYYRSQFLNTVLPGGVLGDVHRAYRHGRDTGDAIAAARAVATERVVGQVVQLAIVLGVLAVLGTSAPVGALEWIAVGVLVAVVGLGLAAISARVRRLLARELHALRRVVASPGRAVAVVASSAIVVACHAATFVVACVAVGVVASPRELVVLALVALCAASVPLSLGGWGPREAASASGFALIGLGADTGLAVSAAFGVLTMIAAAPGAAVLVADRIVALRARRAAARLAGARPPRLPQENPA